MGSSVPLALPGLEPSLGERISKGSTSGNHWARQGGRVQVHGREWAGVDICPKGKWLPEVPSEESAFNTKERKRGMPLRWEMGKPFLTHLPSWPVGVAMCLILAHSLGSSFQGDPRGSTQTPEVYEICTEDLVCLGQ